MLRTFVQDESGVVTVETIVLMALAVGLCLATIAVTSGGVENLSETMATEMAETEVAPLF